MKRALIIILILTVVIGSSAAGYWYLLAPKPPKSVADDPTAEIVPAELKTLVDTVNATGKIEPKTEIEMKFEIGGVVEQVLVARGQPVTAGDVLARLRTDKLELAVEEAEIDLTQQEAELERLFEPELDEDIAAAQARIDSARLNLSELFDGPDADALARAEAELRLKQIDVKKAQWEYDKVAYLGSVGAMPQADALQEATLNLEIAQAGYNQAVKESTNAEIAQARSTLAEAEAALAKLLRGPSPAEVASRQSALDKARLNLREARNNLKDAVLTAPTGGVLLSVNIEPGERVLSEADTPAMSIANTSAYLLKVAVDEIDIARIRRGQPAQVTLDAFLDAEFSGQVTDIAPSPAQGDSGGIVTYEVTIMLDTSGGDPGLLPGMTATAAIETRRLDDVVVVPNRAIQIERGQEKSTVFVEKLDETGNPVRAEVELGLRDGDVTEIKAGVTADDEVIIRTEPEPGNGPDL